jgi:hypothetical protein
MEKVLEEIPGEHHLRHVDSNDKSKPVIDPDVKLHTWDKEGLLHGIEAGVPLKHVQPDDRSAPHIDPNVHLQPNHHKELMEEVKAAAGHVAVVRELNSVSDAAGAGDGAEDATVNPLVGQLHHVETVDKSKPVIDANTHVQKWDKEGFLQEVSAEHRLHHVDPSQIHDASKPVIPGDAQVVESPAKAVLQQISSGELPHLKHVQAPQ